MDYKSSAPAIVIFNTGQVDDVGSALEVVKNLRKHKPRIFILLIAFVKEEIQNLRPLVDFYMFFQNDYANAANWTLQTLCR